MKNYKRLLVILLCIDICLIYVAIGNYNNKLRLSKPVKAAEEILVNSNEDPIIDEETVKTDEALNGEILCDSEFVEEKNVASMVVPSGEPIGIYVKSQGVMVIGIGEISGADGDLYSPCVGMVDSGDYILSIEGEMIDDKAELVEIVNELGGQKIEMAIQKNTDSGDMIIETVTVNPIKSQSGDYMLGLWVKDDISGIGTLTYFSEDGFGALGHSINDNDTGKIFYIKDGAIYKADLVNIIKSANSLPGRLEGMIDYSSKNMIGRIEENEGYGIKGYLTNVGKKTLDFSDAIPIASKEEVHRGEAYLLSSVSGEAQYYTVEITNVNYDFNQNKEIQLRVTDSRLINLTSGIVQGMSGTPIIQDGKLVGAVTHVLVDDPTKGYGVFIEEMIK